MEAGTTVATIEIHRNRDDVRLPSYSVHMDAIRSIAAFLVLAGHARMLFFGNHDGSKVTSAAISTAKTLGLGHHAVIVFFVLSGFLVGNSAWRSVCSGRWSWKKYLLQRMTRLWIVLIPALLIGGVLDHIGMRYLAHSGSIFSGPAGQSMVDATLPERSTIQVLAGNIFFLQTIRVPNFGTNDALWSLANEFWYYITFPAILLIFLGNRSSLKRIGYALMAAAILLFVGPKIGLQFGIWLLGFVVSILPLKISQSYRLWVTGACLLQFLAVNALIRSHHVSILLADTVLGLSFSILLYAIVHARQPVRSVHYQKAAKHFSQFSYSLYLMHLPFLTFITGIMLVPWHPWNKTPIHFAQAVLMVVIAYCYSWMAYLLFERNTNKLRLWASNLISPATGPQPGEIKTG